MRWTQPDTILNSGSQGLNRYSYVLENPIIYNDPTGNKVCPDGGCETVDDVLQNYGVKATDYSFYEKWEIVESLQKIAHRLYIAYKVGCQRERCDDPSDPISVFKSVFDGIVFQRNANYTNGVCGRGGGGVYCASDAAIAKSGAIRTVNPEQIAQSFLGGKDTG
jgi:hypothetical protein